MSASSCQRTSSDAPARPAPHGAHIEDHGSVRALLADPRLTPNRLHAFADRASPAAVQAVHRHAPWLITPQASDHDWIAGTLRAGLTSTRVIRHKAAVEAIGAELVDDLQGHERFDVVEDYAVPLSAAALDAYLGADERLLGVGRELVTFFAQTQITPQGAERMARAVSTIVAAVRTALAAPPAESYLAVVAGHAQRLGRPPHDGELLSVTLPLVTGFVDTANLVAVAAWLALCHPPAWERIHADPRLLPGAVTESLRMGAPVATVPRFALQAVVAGECHVASGGRLQLSLAAANRDPSRFPAPDTFDITRGSGPGLAFGHGPHRCRGSGIARTHATAALALLSRAFAGLALDAPDHVRWAPIAGTHLLEHLPVRTRSSAG